MHVEDPSSLEPTLGRKVNAPISASVHGQCQDALRHLEAKAGIAVVAVYARGTSSFCPRCLRKLAHYTSAERVRRVHSGGSGGRGQSERAETGIGCGRSVRVVKGWECMFPSPHRIVGVHLPSRDHQRAHQACHTATWLRNQAVAWVRGEWEAGQLDPSKYDIRAFLTALPAAERPLHTHSTAEIADDLKEAIRPSRSNRRAGMKVRAPWRTKQCRPLSFTAGYGWRVHDGALHLSLGRGRPRLMLRLPEVADPTLTDGAWGRFSVN